MGKDDYSLKHKKRKMIYEHILAHPGVSFSILKKVFDLKDSTLRYHLEYLKKNDQIVFSSMQGKRNYFPRKIDSIYLEMDENNFKSYKVTHIQKKIISIIKDNPNLNQKELSKKLEMNRFTLRNHLNKLLKLSLIRKINKDRNVCYEYISNEELQYEIQVNLILRFLKGEIDEETFIKIKNRLENHF